MSDFNSINPKPSLADRPRIHRRTEVRTRGNWFIPNGELTLGVLRRMIDDCDEADLSDTVSVTVDVNASGRLDFLSIDHADLAQS